MSNTINFKDKLKFISQYFLESDEKLSAWLFLIGSIACVFALVGLTAVIAWWSVGFWAALIAMNWALFQSSIIVFSVLVTFYVGLSCLQNYLVDKLCIRWRHWLSKKMQWDYLSPKNKAYLRLAIFTPKKEEVDQKTDQDDKKDDIDNISQRIQSEIKSFVTDSMSLSLGFIKSVISLLTFTSTLWVVGGTLSFALAGLNIVIPGYLVWIALIFAIVTTAITWRIGSPLTALNKKKAILEADYRICIDNTKKDAPGIALERAELFYKRKLELKLQAITAVSNSILKVDNVLTAFRSFCARVQFMLPLTVAAPLYFAGKIVFDQLNQISMCFTEVTDALGWFADSYESISWYNISLNRLVALKNAIEIDPAANKKKIVVNNTPDAETIRISSLTIEALQEDSTSKILMRNLNLVFKKGEHVFIQARAGLGKSSLFKVLSGNWPYGEGEVTVPPLEEMYFVPQTPILGGQTLRAILAYPHHDVTIYTDDQYTDALTAAGCLQDLNLSRDWSTLSSGEKQRVCFARILLKQPKWLFLDEATASLDEEGENFLYDMIRRLLPNTTIISIAHRSTVAKHHHKIVKFSSEGVDSDTVVEELPVVVEEVPVPALVLAPVLQRIQRTLKPDTAARSRMRSRSY